MSKLNEQRDSMAMKYHDEVAAIDVFMCSHATVAMAAFTRGFDYGAEAALKLERERYETMREENERLWVVADQLHRWQNAWGSQDDSDREPARKAMFKALAYAIANRAEYQKDGGG